MILSVIVILIGIRILLLEAPLGFCNFHGFLPRVQRMQPVGISSRSRVQLRASAGPTVAELESFIQKATNPGDTATVSKYSRQQEDDVCLQLNVGGDIMASTRKTLMSVHEDSKLYKMMDNPTWIKTDASSSITRPPFSNYCFRCCASVLTHEAHLWWPSRFRTSTLKSSSY